MLHSSPTWMMPHPKDVQPDPSPNSVDERLDASSLNTVLDMLAVIDSAEELALLEMLTPAQKRQVWDATPDSLKLRLKQIRAGQRPSAALHVAEPFAEPQDEPGQEGKEAIAAALPELPETKELQENSELQEDSELQERLPDVMDAVFQNPLPQVGDRVVLLAKPQLTAAEMATVWQVVEVQAEHARLEAKTLGSRRYPLSWMIIYPG